MGPRMSRVRAAKAVYDNTPKHMLGSGTMTIRDPGMSTTSEYQGSHDLSQDDHDVSYQPLSLVINITNKRLCSSSSRNVLNVPTKHTSGRSRVSNGVSCTCASMKWKIRDVSQEYELKFCSGSRRTT